ncbi:hypothetical protein [Brachybacterium sp. HMSC06H03]|uniref:hypothetical protein n=1 Tax=Brachybacterium sp. HMSC06H03 TaxID=1581127 RepID=UPI00114CB1FC|nr:hypothetical protein [Brachybacterium sp. HMSC06H03]
MDSEPAHRKPPNFQKPLVGRRPEDRTIGKKVHATHRTHQVKIRGLIMDLPGAEEPVEVCVNDQADWELIYKNPAVHVKCIVSSCDTLLTAKRMSASGLRFLAVRSGGCDHNLVEMPVNPGEIAQDPATLDGGGGPEGVEHLWIKGRLYRIAKKLGAEAVVEHSPTHGDVFLPEHDLVLEYQRWNTDFATRTLQRTTAGAARTIWLFPAKLPERAPKSLSAAVRKEVFQNGGIYVAVLNPRDNYAPQRPWEDPSQERNALLFARGSIAEFDPDRQALIYKSRSLAAILAEILSGERVLQQAPVWKKKFRRLEMARVWVLRSDLELSSTAQSRRRAISAPASSNHTASEHSDEPRPEQAFRPEVELATGLDTPQSHSDAAPSVTAADRSPLTEEQAKIDAEPIVVSTVEAAQSASPQTADQDMTTERPASARPLWKKFVDWLRQA